MVPALIAAVISVVSVHSPHPFFCCGGPLSNGRLWVGSGGRHGVVIDSPLFSACQPSLDSAIKTN